jgi:hypothetical protein
MVKFTNLIVCSYSKQLLYHAELLRDEILIANLMHFLSILFDIFKYHILVQVNNLERLLHNRRWGILLPETVPAQRAIRLFFQFEPKPNFSQSKKIPSGQAVRAETMVALEHLLNLRVPANTAGLIRSNIDEPFIILYKYHLALIRSSNYF